jgi:chromosome segregation ATPase
MKKVVTLSILALALFFFSSGKTLAIVPRFIPEEAQLNPNPQVELNVEAMKAIHKKWCEKIQNKINEKHGSLEEKKGKHMERYDNLKSRLNTLIERLSAKGYDTAQLEKDLSDLGVKIDKFSSDFEVFKTKKEELKTYVCDKTNAEFKAKLAETKVALKTLQKDAKDIKDFYKNQIKPDIKDLKNQKI